jgi:sugar O-acyltransferase (sialic acid O-acetyltransferase NeuD family)
MFQKVGLIGKGGFVKEVFYSINKHNKHNKHKFNPYILSDLDNSLQTFLLQNQDTKYLLCIGDSFNREKTYINLQKYNIKLYDYLKYYISNNVDLLDKESIIIGNGSIICSGSVLTCGIIIGKMVHININSTIGHDVKIGNFVTCSPGVNISGNCNIGNNVMIGSNSVIKENISIGDNIIIGMGSVVTKSLIEPGVYVGNPCKLMNNLKK